MRWSYGTLIGLVLYTSFGYGTVIPGQKRAARDVERAAATGMGVSGAVFTFALASAKR